MIPILDKLKCLDELMVTYAVKTYLNNDRATFEPSYSCLPKAYRLDYDFLYNLIEGVVMYDDKSGSTLITSPEMIKCNTMYKEYK